MTATGSIKVSGKPPHAATQVQQINTSFWGKHKVTVLSAAGIGFLLAGFSVALVSVLFPPIGLTIGIGALAAHVFAGISIGALVTAGAGIAGASLSTAAAINYHDQEKRKTKEMNTQNSNAIANPTYIALNSQYNKACIYFKGQTKTKVVSTALNTLDTYFRSPHTVLDNLTKIQELLSSLQKAMIPAESLPGTAPTTRFDTFAKNDQINTRNLTQQQNDRFIDLKTGLLYNTLGDQMWTCFQKASAERIEILNMNPQNIKEREACILRLYTLGGKPTEYTASPIIEKLNRQEIEKTPKREKAVEKTPSGDSSNGLSPRSDPVTD